MNFMENNEFVLTNENYHSMEARKLYLGSSQFKDFLAKSTTERTWQEI